jgi:hypothetical protein
MAQTLLQSLNRLPKCAPGLFSRSFQVLKLRGSIDLYVIGYLLFIIHKLKEHLSIEVFSYLKKVPIATTTDFHSTFPTEIET